MKKGICFAFACALILLSCNKSDEDIPYENHDYKQLMREFIIGISNYAKQQQPGFFIIPQNGIELVSNNGEESGAPHRNYLQAIDANGQEDLFFGYDQDDKATPTQQTDYLTPFLNISKQAGKIILVTDYCWTPSKVTQSYSKNTTAGYVSFAADSRELQQIPQFPLPIPGENPEDITKMEQVKNFLYLINSSQYNTKADFINAVTATNYDLVIMDLFFNEGSSFTSAEIDALRMKSNGGKRLLIAYISIGEAEDYRYYWKSSWKQNPPAWMAAENPHWEGNYKVKYWNSEWQQIIYGNENSYLKQILNAGFDGAYLDIIDAFEYFEDH